MGPVIMSVEEQQSLISSRAENALKNSSGSPSINSGHRHISSIKSFADNSNVNEKLGKTSNGNVKLGTGIIVLFNLFLGVCLFWALREHPSSSSLIDSDRSRVHLALYNWDYSADLTKNISSSNYESVPPSLPKVLIDRHFYKTTDFENEAGVFVPYWWKHDSSPTRTQESFSGLAKWGPCYVPKDEIEVLGYVHKPTSNGEAKSVNDYYRIPSACETHVQDSNLSGMCTPGFLIIGAGKCGTSSLYFYLIDHPRVAPARQKQIGYFKYFPDEGIKCYLSFFPRVHEFMSQGALITGEAFPGYLPYPDVALRIKETLGANSYGPKIVVSVREPLSRAYSSYKYNYLEPALEKLRRGGIDILVNQTDEYYIKHHVFSFEDMIEAELKFITQCLEPGGRAEQATRDKYSLSGYSNEFRRRDSQHLLPLVDIELCYGQTTAGNTPPVSPQFDDLVQANPEKLIDIPSKNHVIRSFLGRGLYVTALDWWIVVFGKDQIHVQCMEELSSTTEAMSNVTSFLGLPDFDFSTTIANGIYNVGGRNEGFGKRTKNAEVQHNRTSLPISDGLKEQVLAFVENYNQRLFSIIGRKCLW